MDRAPEIARLIFEVANFQSRCALQSPDQLRITPDHIREAANLVFLSLDLINEWKLR